MPDATTAYDVFISYARKDNSPIPPTYPSGWVTAIRDHIAADHRQFSTAPLRLFFDTQEIKDADDWRHRILGALRRSKMLLVCLSPGYFDSKYCRWEWDEYIKRQVHQLMGSDSVATVYFAEAPGTDEQDAAKWRDEILRGNYTDLRPWFPEGAEALQREEVRQRMARLGETLWQRLERARRAMAVPGNLRWQNPHFVGRHEELRLLHEQLALGAVGVVTAVQGLGGQGKTELAVAYAHGFADSYPAGLWSLGAEGKTGLLPLIGELAWERALGFTPTEAEKNDPNLLGRGVLEHLRQRAAAVLERDPDRGAACLLLLDNVSDPALLSPPQLATLPGGMGCQWLRIVATTRLDLSAQKDRLALLPVHSLDEDTALTLIRDHQLPRDAQRRLVPDLSQGEPQFASDAEEAAAREIVRALDGFTLAVEQVALYLGLHPEVTPTDFLTTLRAQGLTAADDAVRDPGVAAQMLTQSKQLGLILDATLAWVDAPTRTALAFAALLPPDAVPWPWLRSLTVQLHPEMGTLGPLGADPWLTLRRRLSGLRLLTAGDHPEVARIHRLVAAHLGDRILLVPFEAGREPTVPASDHLDPWVECRANTIADSQATPAPWELDALVLTLPHLVATRSSRAIAASEICNDDKALLRLIMGTRPSRSLAIAAGNVSMKLKTYRSLHSAATLMATCQAITEHRVAHAALQRTINRRGDTTVEPTDLAGALRSPPESANLDWHLSSLSVICDAIAQHEHSFSLNRLGDLAVAQGDLDGALRSFLEAWDIRNRLAASDTTNFRLQHDLSVSLIKLGELAEAQGDLTEALRYFTDCHAIRERLAASDPANSKWQGGLSESLGKLGDLAMAQGDFTEALRYFTECHTIREHLVASDSANAEWERDLWVSYGRLANLASAQDNPSKALGLWTVANGITQRRVVTDPANTERQRDLSVSLNGLGEIALAQGDLTAAFRYFADSKAIRERLAASDPANANWQRDLAVSHFELFELAQEKGDEDMMEAELRACFLVLDGMKRRGMHFDPQMARLYGQLAGTLASSSFGSGNTGVVVTVDRPAPMTPAPDKSSQARDPAGSGIASLRAGRAGEALAALRPVVFPGDSVAMDPDAPLDARVGFVQALWLSGNVDGVENYLPVLREQDDSRVRTMTDLLTKWKKGLTWTQKAGFGRKPALPTLPLLDDGAAAQY